MDSRLILVVIGVIAMAFGRSEAVTCYSCTSETDSRCLDPFNSRGVRTCQGVSCAKGRATESGIMVVYRNCSLDSVPTDFCGDATVSGFKVRACVCKTNYCNDGQLVKPSIYSVFIGVAMATVTVIVWKSQI